MNVDSYSTISAVENILHKEKASKFIGYAYPVTQDYEIREKIEMVKLQHPKATHHCYAFRLGMDKHNFRCNDDGEPSGTAGKPILGQIDSKRLKNLLVIIVRYYGGTKLGVSGLIGAYKECAKLTLEHAQIIEKKILAYYLVNTDYIHLNRLYQYIQQYKAIILDQEIANECVFKIGIEQSQMVMFESELKVEKIQFKFVEMK